MQKIHKYVQAIRIGVIAVLLCAGIVSQAQTITGSVNGTVTDPSGAVIPNAKVVATNVDTGIATDTTTNNDGIYNIRFLQIGNYKVTIESPGFAAATFGPFALETGQNAKIDGKLGLAGQMQKVAVESEMTPLMNTENPTLATTLDARAIDNMPLVSRNLIALTMFLPGAVSTNPNGFVNQAAISGPLATDESVSARRHEHQPDARRHPRLQPQRGCDRSGTGYLRKCACRIWQRTRWRYSLSDQERYQPLAWKRILFSFQLQPQRK